MHRKLRHTLNALRTRTLCIVAFSAALSTLPTDLSAQQLLRVAASANELPDAPSSLLPPLQQSPNAEGSHLSGTITTENGEGIEGALVTVENPGMPKRTALSDGDGFFQIGPLPAGTYQVTITANDFGAWSQGGIVVQAGQDFDLPKITLKIATVNTEVEAITQHQLAAEELKAEVQQRILGFIPNFYVSYEPNPAPLSSGQKFHLATRASIDPTTFAFVALAAGIEQANGAFSGYGSGPSGYGKRYGAALADTFSGAFFGGAIYPSLFHQDPRYIYKGTGTVRSRALYALSSAVRCKGDNGHWQPNYSFILGNFTAGALSNAYYPDSNRGAGLTFTNALIATASASVGALVEEFFLSKITSKHKRQP